MYDHETEKFGLCRNSDLIEELGQIDFVFSDKTGTLTQNKMIFKKCTVLNTIFGDPLTPDEAMAEDMVQSSKARISDYIFNKSNEQISRKLKDFFTMLAVCHTCMVEKDPKNMSVLKYSASSPDELALVQGAKSVGIEYVKRTSTNITISLNPIKQEEDYEVICEFPFDSTRKRMSLIVKHL